MSLAQIDFAQIPAPAVVEVLDFEAILAAMKTDLLARDATLTAIELESDPSSKILEGVAYRELNLRQRVNDAAHAVMTPYATESDLDQRGANVNVQRLTGETDTALRARIQKAFNLLAAAGPAESYKQHALAVDVSIADVNVVSIADGQVTVTVLVPDSVVTATATPNQLLAGQAAFPSLAPPSGSSIVISGDNAPVMATVRTRLNDPAVKPLTDVVIVRSPTAIPFSIVGVLTIYPGPDANVVLSDALKSLHAHLADIKHMGFDATRSGLIAALTVPGVQNVALSSPAADVIADALSIALAISINITVGGIDV